MTQKGSHNYISITTNVQNFSLKKWNVIYIYIHNQVNCSLMLSLSISKNKKDWIKAQSNNTTNAGKPEKKKNKKKYINW